jgi:hypothetical protein
VRHEPAPPPPPPAHTHTHIHTTARPHAAAGSGLQGVARPQQRSRSCAAYHHTTPHHSSPQLTPRYNSTRHSTPRARMQRGSIARRSSVRVLTRCTTGRHLGGATHATRVVGMRWHMPQAVWGARDTVTHHRSRQDLFSQHPSKWVKSIRARALAHHTRTHTQAHARRHSRAQPPRRRCRGAVSALLVGRAAVTSRRGRRHVLAGARRLAGGRCTGRRTYDLARVSGAATRCAWSWLRLSARVRGRLQRLVHTHLQCATAPRNPDTLATHASNRSAPTPTVKPCQRHQLLCMARSRLSSARAHARHHHRHRDTDRHTPSNTAQRTSATAQLEHMDMSRAGRVG